MPSTSGWITPPGFAGILAPARSALDSGRLAIRWPRASRSRRITRRRGGSLLASFLIAIASLVGLGVWSMPRSWLAPRVVIQPSEAGYRYYLIGNSADVAPQPRPGMVLAGGGTDLDEAFRWMIDRSGGGDFLVLRTTGTDAYNPYVFDLTTADSVRADSVATLIISDRAAARDPFVLAKIRDAEAIWLAGGDQARHVSNWRDTPLARAIDAAASGRIPVGGTSSGLAVMGEFVFSAEADAPDDSHLTSSAVLKDPYHPRVTLRRDILRLPHLAGILLEPHFMQESRHGRMATFLSRIVRDGWAGEVRGLGIDRKTALLVEPDGKARVIAAPDHPSACVSAFRLAGTPENCEPGRALSAGGIEMVRIDTGGSLDLITWETTRGRTSRFSIAAGVPKVETAP